MSSEAPQNWRRIALGDVISLEYGRALPENSRRMGSIPVYGSNGIVGWHDDALVHSGGIVIGRKGTAGSVNVSTGPFWPIDTAYFVETRQRVDKVWLAAMLQHACLGNLNEATGVPGLNRDNAYRQSVLLPPFEEQQRIADVLRSMDGAAETAIGVISQLRATKSAEAGKIFLQVSAHHTSKDLADVGWRRVRLGQIFSERSEAGSKGIPIASVSIERGLVMRAALDRRVQSDLPPESHSLVCTNDIAYNMMRMWQGACGIALHDCLVSPAYVVVTPSPSLNPRFAYHMLRSKPVIRLLHGYSQGVVDDRLRLYPKNFFQIPINLPPIARQLEVAATLDAYDAALLSAEGAFEAKVNVRTKFASDLISGRVRLPAPAVIKNDAVTPAFKRAVFSAEVVQQLRDDKLFGAVKHEKIVYLCETHLDLHQDLDRTPQKRAAGPYDPAARQSVERVFELQRWFLTSNPDGKRVVYTPLKNVGGHKECFERYFGTRKAAIQSIIDLLRPLDTQQCEIVATLYAVWNDFLIDGHKPTDDEIVASVYDWHPKKQEIPRSRWLRTLQWMRVKSLTPKGTGKKIQVPGA